MNCESTKTLREWTLVTGAAKGLGAEICRVLAASGHNLIIHYNASIKEAESLVKECKELGAEAMAIQGDFSSMEKIQDFILQLSSKVNGKMLITNLVSNVGNYLVESLLATTVEQWNQLFQTNLFAPIALTNALMPSIKSNRGAIINLGVAGINHVPADVYASAYTATKLALWFATKSFAKALAQDGVRVNMISPGMLENSVDLNSNTLPMGRAGTLYEVARLVVFLLDRENSYITGQNIEVAGALRL